MYTAAHPRRRPPLRRRRHAHPHARTPTPTNAPARARTHSLLGHTQPSHRNDFVAHATPYAPLPLPSVLSAPQHAHSALFPYAGPPRRSLPPPRGQAAAVNHSLYNTWEFHPSIEGPDDSLGIAGTPPSGQPQTSWLGSDAACCPGMPGRDLGAIRASPARASCHFSGPVVLVSTIHDRAATFDRGPRAARARERWLGGQIPRVKWFYERERAGFSRVDRAGWLWPPRMASPN